MQLSDQTLLRSQAYINGAWVHSHSGATLSVSNPADGTELGRVPDMGAEEARAAVAAAEAAWPAWRRLPDPVTSRRQSRSP